MDICLHILALILPTALHNLSLNCTIFDSPSRIWVAYKNSKFAPRRIQLTFIEITACASLSLSLLLCLSLTVYLMPHFSRDSWQHCLKFCCKFQFFHATFPTCCLSISSICREECVCVCAGYRYIFAYGSAIGFWFASSMVKRQNCNQNCKYNNMKSTMK